MLALLILVFAAKHAGQSEEDPNLQSRLCQWEKLDALVLKQAGHTVLIDTGEKDDGDKIVRFRKIRGSIA